MAVVTRYFSTTGAGAADGTTWADRAALLSAGAFSTVITGFDFSGSDSLLCYVGPGTYSITNDLAAADFSTAAPTAANSITFHGCDSSGNALSPPDPDWTSDQPAWDDSTLPEFATTTNIRSLNLTAQTAYARLIKFTATGANQTSVNGTQLTWCTVSNSSANSAAAAVGTGSLYNCVVTCTGSSYGQVYAMAAGNTAHNVRVVGVAGSSGNRIGIQMDGNGTFSISRCTVISCGGVGISWASGTTSPSASIVRCTIANNGGKGILLNSTASQTQLYQIIGCCITGNGTNGIDASASRVMCFGNRLRDNTTNFANFGNHSTDNNYVTDSDDATEYVDSSGGDYRIKSTAAIWGQSYGVSDQAASGGGLITHPGMAGNLNG